MFDNANSSSCGRSGSQLHIVRRTFVRHKPTHRLLEERLAEHHQMGNTVWYVVV